MNKLYLDYNDIEKYCSDIARKITFDMIRDWRPDYIVGLTRGGLLPATLLSQYLNIHMHSLDVSLRDNKSDMGPSSNLWMAEDALAGKNILIVDDINDTGATLDWIVDDWKAGNMPKSTEWDNVFGNNVRIATIINNEVSEFKNISYSGLTINKMEKDVWVVFPWEDWWTAKP